MSSPRLFLNSVPKAGAHLAEKALAAYGYARGQGPLGSSTVFGRQQLVKSIMRRPWVSADVVLVGIEVVAPVTAAWVRRRLSGVAPGQYLRGHVQHSGAFAALLDELDYRVLHVVRDPRDVVVSHAHYMMARPRHPFHRFYDELGGWSERLAFSITGGWVPGAGYLVSIAERYRLMEVWLEHPGALTLRFEELVGERGGGSAAVQLSSLRRLGELIGQPSVDPAEIADGIFGGSSTFRKGRIGGWEESFGDEHRDLFDRVAGDLLVRWRYS
jgi:hypothetical protein